MFADPGRPGHFLADRSIGREASMSGVYEWLGMNYTKRHYKQS